MLRVLLIRPGTTDYDEQGRIKGRLDIPLNRQGMDQLARTVREISDQAIEIIYAAPSATAVATGQAVATATGAKIRQVTGLQNLNPGLWQGKLIEEVKSQHPKVYRRWQEQPQTICPPEGEMLSAAQQRLTEVMERIVKKHKNGIIAVVAPEPVASVLSALLKQQELGDLWQAETNCGHWELVEVHPASPVAQ